jgi:hypothetical protein
MAALLNQGTGALREMENELSNSQGYASSAAAAMDEGFGGALRESGNALEAMKLSLGQAVATVATPLLFAFSAIGKSIAALPQPIWVAIAAIGALAAAGLGVLSVISIAGMMLPGLITGLTAMGVVEAGATLTTAGLGAAIWAALAPVTAVVVAAGLLVAGLYILEKETGILSSAWRLLKDIFTIVADGIMKAAGILRDAVVEKIQEIKEAVANMLPPGVADGIKNAIGGIVSQFSTAGDNIHEQAEKVRKDSDGVSESLTGWGKYDPSNTVSNISMVDSIINQTSSDALTAAGGVEDLMNVDSGVTADGISGINSELQNTVEYGENVYDILSETGSVSLDQLNTGLSAIESAEQDVADTGSEMFYIISDAGNVRMDGTNSQLVAINDNGSMSALTIRELQDYLQGTSNVSQGGTIQQLALVDQQGKSVNLTTQQAITLLQNAGNQPATGTIAGWNGVRSSIQGAIGDAYKFISVNNEVASSISKIGAAYKTTAEQVGNLSGLAGKWNLRETPGTTKSSGGKGTGEENVKVKDPKGLYSNSTTNVKINTVNNNGSSTSKNNLKKAGVA